VPAVVAVALTAVVGWGAPQTARAAAWPPPGDPSWYRLLAPDAGLLPAGLFLAWSAALFEYWRPRRRRSRATVLVAVVGMALIGTFLGFCAYLPCGRGQSWVAVWGWVLGLFAGNVADVYGPDAGAVSGCPGAQPLALQVAGAVCLGATLAGAVAAAAALWGRQVARMRARFVRQPVLVTGLDATTLPLLEQLCAQSPRSVVVLEPDQHHPLLDQVRGLGARVVAVDPTSVRGVLSVLSSPPLSSLRRLYALTPAVRRNELVLEAVADVLRVRRPLGGPRPHLVCRVDDPRLAQTWRGEAIGRSELFVQDALNPTEIAVEAMLAALLEAGTRTVYLCGDSLPALVFLVQQARGCWERSALAEALAEGFAPGVPVPPDARLPPHGPAEVVVVAPTAAALVREYEVTCPDRLRDAAPAPSVVARPWEEAVADLLDARPEADRGASAVVVMDDPTPDCMHRAGRMAKLYRSTAVHVLVAEGTGLDGPLFDGLRAYERALVVDGVVPDDNWTRLARLNHECHRRRYPQSAPGRAETRRPWAALRPELRDDNVEHLRAVMVAVAHLGRVWTPTSSVPVGSHVELTDVELRAVARGEHGRWLDAQVALWGAEVEGGLRRPWVDLTVAAQHSNVDQIMVLLERLEAVGFVPALTTPDGAGTFRRTGAVRARRLTGPHTWESANGDRMAGAAGDWLVSDGRGTRTVADHVFRRTHEPDGEGRWRRTGTVLAWQVAQPTAVRTLEGRTWADAGGWIVEGENGDRWPVTADHFRAGYASAGAGPSGGPSGAGPG